MDAVICSGSDVACGVQPRGPMSSADPPCRRSVVKISYFGSCALVVSRRLQQTSWSRWYRVSHVHRNGLPREGSGGQALPSPCFRFNLSLLALLAFAPSIVTVNSTQRSTINDQRSTTTSRITNDVVHTSELRDCIGDIRRRCRSAGETMGWMGQLES